jgi:enoyl-CoA hydratase/carnithine racemase
MDATPVRYEALDQVATITLDRPEVRNALNRAAYAELEGAFRRAQRDPDVRCVVVTGADPAFCSGDDVKAIMLGAEREGAVEALRQVRPRTTPAAAAALECDRPLIAAVNGPAMGWGMDLALLCDIRIASERARFAELFVQRGVIADVGGLWRLPQVVGPSRAAELLFTGDPIDAPEAERIGLVSRVVPHEELLPSALTLARRIAQNPPLAVRHMKEGLRRAARGDVDELGAWIGSTLAYLFTTEDHREGARAFVEKRAPRFVGR